MALLKRKRIGLNDAMSVVTRFVNACNRHDADGVASCLHPDFDSIQPMYPARNFRGADQVRRNWQAIFDAEPGFRLTVLRSASMEDTVWLELHGAGRDAEVAGIFIMGVQGDRIRWARIYSALVEAVPAGMAEQAAPLHEAGQAPEAPAASGEVVEDELIAPVLDIERSGRRRRRRRSDEAAPAADSEMAEAPDGGATAVAEAVPEAPAEEELAALDDLQPVAVDLVDAEGAAVGIAPGAPVAVVELAIDDAPPEMVAVVVDEADVVEQPEAPAAVEEPPAVAAPDDGGPPTEAVEMVTLTEAETGPDPEPAGEPEPEPVPEPPAATAPPAFEPPKRRFGKRPRS